MSFFSSLKLVYPGTPPILDAETLYQFAARLHKEVGVRSDSRSRVEIKYGKRIDQDTEFRSDLRLGDSGLLASLFPFRWDKSLSGVPWKELPDGWRSSKKNIYRASIDLGYLTQEASAHLRRQHPSDQRSFIAPDSVSVSVNPFSPQTLRMEPDDDGILAGMMTVYFPGNGYFSWGPPWSAYAEQYAQAGPIVTAKRIARTFFPVRRDGEFERVANYLGDVFLNRDCYEEGDWILTVSESG